MLFNIAYSKDDDCFKEFVRHIQTAYWPEERYKSPEIVKMLKGWTDPPSELEMIKEIKDQLKEMVKKICSDGLYMATNNGACDNPVKMDFPFLKWFHELFLQRQYDFPYRDPRIQKDNLLRLKPSGRENAIDENYSKNHGNYNHFTNVVMATARIIRYFTDGNHILELFDPPGKLSPKEIKYLCENLPYPDKPVIRTFKLMLAAFYHDIGKTIVDHRHGMEGSFIIADHTTHSLSQLDAISKSYNPNDYTFEREDLLEISTFLYYHDSFGTLGTGESSYTLMTDIIDRIKRSCLKYLGKPEKQKACGNRTLFDLWVLNIADIIVSIRDKPILQEYWYKNENGEVTKIIKDFFKSEGGKNRIHDLRVALKLLQKHNKGTHRDDTLELEEMAQGEARAHTVERIRRLVGSSLQVAIIQFIKDKPNSKVERDILNHIMDTKDSLGKYIMSFSPGVMHSVIFRIIQSLNDPQEFYKRLAWIVSMDYALGFFQKIAYRAIEAVNEELNNEGYVTGWICSKASFTQKEAPDDYVHKAHAMFFIDNYCAIIVRMLAHLLFRERSIDQPSNIEFEDARNRLINEKINKIIGLEGPYRQNNSIELILKTVFVY